MQTSVAEFPAGASAGSETAARTSALPWYCYVVALAAACIPIGALWDISWHSTIGRDSFWTPAHMMIYLGGALPGMVCGWIVLKASYFSTEAERGATVRYFGFHGPMGAWVCIWGSLTMLVSAPFDNWWHDAYGLDVEILSPPHTLLALGMYAVAVGAMLLVLAWQNRGDEAAGRAAGRLFLFSMGVLLVMASIILTEMSYPNAQHRAQFYKVNCVPFAFYLALALRASKEKWAGTWASLWYMLIVGGMVWILPLFKAEPLLAPIYLKVERMVPPVFPLLLVVPAFFMDLARQRLKGNDWILAGVLGVIFVGLFLAAQWKFSEFMMFSDWAKNSFFAAGRQWPYFVPIGPWRGEFWRVNEDPVNVRNMAIVIVLAAVSARAGLGMGNWMSKVRR
jgi:hypothetical protein